MVAQLVEPNGTVEELSMEEYIIAKAALIEQLPTEYERLAATLKLIEATKEEGDAEWWGDFEKFLQENRVHFPERDLGLDNE